MNTNIKYSISRVVTICNSLDIDRKSVGLELLIELLEPLLGAESIRGVLEVLAVLVVLALELHASLIVDEVDEAVLGLLLVGKSRVEFRRPACLGAEVLS